MIFEKRNIMKSILKGTEYWGQLILLPIYALSYLMPRSKNIWVLGSTFGKRFADNPKYFYLYLNQYRSEQIRSIWISKKKEVVKLLQDNHLEGYYLYSFKGIWYSLRAKVYLYDNYSKDICFTLSGGAVKINLWHGIPLKKIQNDNKFDRVRNPRTAWEKYRWMLRRISDEKPTDYVLTTADYLRPIFTSAFGTERVITCGYPRNDNLMTEKIKNVLSNREKEMLELIKVLKKDYRVAFYLPTFRDSEIEFFDVINLERFEAFLEQENIIFLVKLHPKSKLQEKFLQIANSKILVINPQDDPYPLLNLTDVLVTDYSSIYFDFLLTEKPIIFFPYDIKEYLSNSREMYFDYDEFTPGAKVYYQSELEDALLHDISHEHERKKILQKTYDVPEGFSSKQLYTYIIKILNR